MTEQTIQIIFSDDTLIFAVKPAGVDSEHEMPELLKKIFTGEIYCVHRLDLNVSGLMVYARTKASAAALSADIAENRFHKEYTCVCAGIPDPESGEMQDYLLKDNMKKKAFPVRSMRKGVKEARLHYEVQKTFVNGDETPVSLVQVYLETGRFHQIRVQFASRKHPLVGDQKYGSRMKAQGIALMSTGIRCRHPKTKEELEYRIEYAKEQFPWNLFTDH